MAARTSRPSKLSTPRLARVVPRARLHRRLDRARRAGVAWITAQPGAGKTALVSGWLRARRLPHAWLTLDRADAEVPVFFHWLALAAGGAARRRLPRFSPEYLAAPAAYARRFLRAWFAGARRRAVLVLDDYQELAAGSPLHEALAEGLGELPPGAAVVVLSRAAPPPALAAVEERGGLVRIGGEELVLRPAEAQRIAALWGCTRRDRADVAALHARAEGWAAGLVLLLAARRGRGGAGPDDGGRLPGYLAQELLGRAEPAVRRVLLETSLLPAVTGPMAAAITGDPRAGEVLADLAWRGFFVARHHQGYRFHALVREHLHARAPAEVGEARWSEVRRAAARLLEEAGQPEEAVQLLAQEGAWEDAARLVLAEGPRAMELGRSEAVARWIAGLPASERGRPRLQLLQGEALRLLDPRAALGCLERAEAGLRDEGDGAGECLAWALAVDTLVYVLVEPTGATAWLDRLEDLRARHPGLGGPAVEPRLVAAAVGAFAHLRPADPAFRFWEERAVQLALSPGEARWRLKLAHTLLLFHGALVYDLAAAQRVADAVRPLAGARDAEPVAAMLFHLGDAFQELHRGHPAVARRAVERGLEVAAATGLDRWDVYLLQLQALEARLSGDLEGLERAVRRQAEVHDPASVPATILFHTSAALLAHARGDRPRAREHAQACAGALATVGENPAGPFHQLFLLLIEPPEEVEAELAAVLERTRALGARGIEAGCLVALAAAAAARGDERSALERLRAGLALARERGVLAFPWLRPADLSDLMALALEHGVEPEHAAAIVRAWRLPPGERALSLEAWPFSLRVEALGGFAVLRDGAPLPSGRKEQRRPLELLRALVAAGPQGARQEQLEEALWPEAEGDAAHHALGTAIYRLRRLLGEAGAVLHQGGRVALDPREVYVDAWALERLLARLDALRARGGDGAPEEALRARAAALGRGELFGDDGDGAWRGARERLAAHLRRSLGPTVAG